MAISNQSVSNPAVSFNSVEHLRMNPLPQFLLPHVATIASLFVIVCLPWYLLG